MENAHRWRNAKGLSMPTTPLPVRTERLVLRRFLPTDESDLLAYYSNADVVRYLYLDVLNAAQNRRALEEKCAQTALAAEGDVLSIAVEQPKIGRIIGEVILFHRSAAHEQGEIGFVFNPTYQGRGFATEAVRALLDIGFSWHGLHRLYGRCDVRNQRSLRLMERIGMRKEAHFVHNERFKGDWGDEFVYAMLASEWAGCPPGLAQEGATT